MAPQRLVYPAPHDSAWPLIEPLCARPLPSSPGPGRVYDLDDTERLRPLTPLFVTMGDPAPVALLQADVVGALQADCADQLARADSPTLAFVLSDDDAVEAVVFASAKTTADRTAYLDRIVRSWRYHCRFKDLKGWREERLAVWTHPGAREKVAFFIVRP